MSLSPRVAAQEYSLGPRPQVHKRHTPVSREAAQARAYLPQRLHLEPWTDWQSLRAIQQKYKAQLKLPPDVL